MTKHPYELGWLKFRIDTVGDRHDELHKQVYG